MKTIAIILASFCLTTAAMADSCADQGRRQEARRRGKDQLHDEMHKDAQASCDTQAADKKLAGAAKTSFTKKCVTDATGT